MAPESAEEVREAILRYGRELAFASADIYAHAAEMRGAWDARLEALVVDSIMRGDADESVRTRASALGWDVGATSWSWSGPLREPQGSRPGRRRRRRPPPGPHADLDALGAVQGDRLVVVVGGVSDPDKVGALIAPHFGPGPSWSDPRWPTCSRPTVSAAAAVAGLPRPPAGPRPPTRSPPTTCSPSGPSTATRWLGAILSKCP